MEKNEHKVRKIKRSSSNKVFFGVCGGLGEYFEIDPIIIRITFIALALASGIGILAYIIFALVIPKDGDEKMEKIKERVGGLTEDIKDKAEKLSREAKQMRSEELRMIFGGTLILIGVAIILNELFHFFGIWWVGKMFWPGLLVILGFFFIFSKIGRKKK